MNQPELTVHILEGEDEDNEKTVYARVDDDLGILARGPDNRISVYGPNEARRWAVEEGEALKTRLERFRDRAVHIYAASLVTKEEHAAATAMYGMKKKP